MREDKGAFRLEVIIGVLGKFWWEGWRVDRLGSRKLSREKRNGKRKSDSDSMGEGRNVCEAQRMLDDADDGGGW